MQIFLDPAEKSAHAETPDTIFEPIRAIGIIVELIFSLGEWEVFLLIFNFIFSRRPIGSFCNCNDTFCPAIWSSRRLSSFCSDCSITIYSLQPINLIQCKLEFLFFSMYRVASQRSVLVVKKRHLQATTSIANEYGKNQKALSRDWYRLLHQEARRPTWNGVQKFIEYPKCLLDRDRFLNWLPETKQNRGHNTLMYEYWMNQSKIEAVDPIKLLSGIQESNAEFTVEMLNLVCNDFVVTRKELQEIRKRLRTYRIRRIDPQKHRLQRPNEFLKTMLVDYLKLADKSIRADIKDRLGNGSMPGSLANTLSCTNEAYKQALSNVIRIAKSNKMDYIIDLENLLRNEFPMSDIVKHKSILYRVMETGKETLIPRSEAERKKINEMVESEIIKTFSLLTAKQKSKQLNILLIYSEDKDISQYYDTISRTSMSQQFANTVNMFFPKIKFHFCAAPRVFLGKNNMERRNGKLEKHYFDLAMDDLLVLIATALSENAILVSADEFLDILPSTPDQHSKFTIHFSKRSFRKELDELSSSWVFRDRLVASFHDFLG